MADERDEIIRELVAAMTPFADFDDERAGADHQRVMAMVQTPPLYEYTRSIGLEGVSVGSFRRLRAALERAKEQTP